ncbi:MAG: hypothetical protein HOP18_15900 [Deltaproteobacteria bacterium]|nr:hypothetical protein [Deltaproteobacteria bacterium]
MPSSFRRLFLLFFLLATGGLTLGCGINSARWIDSTFPGFFVLDNRVIASISLSHWPIAAQPRYYQHEVVAVNGQPVTTTAALYTQISQLPARTPVTYTLARDGHRTEVTVSTARFTMTDWSLLFGVYFINGIALVLIGIVAWYWSPTSPMTLALLSLGVSMGLFLITAADLYAPHWFFRLHILTEAAFPAALVHLALVFPLERLRRARSVFLALPYVIAGLLGLGYEGFLYRPQVYTLIHTLCTQYAGIAGVGLLGKMVWDYWSTASVEIRQKIRVVVLGSLTGFGFPAILMLLAGFNGSRFSVNYAAFTLFVFPLSIGYVLVTEDLLRIEMLLRRSVYSLSGLAFVVFSLGIDRPDSHAARATTQQVAASSVRPQPFASIAQDGLDRAVRQSADPLLIQATLFICRQDFFSLCPRLSALDKRTRPPMTLAQAPIAPTRQVPLNKVFSWSPDNMK